VTIPCLCIKLPNAFGSNDFFLQRQTSICERNHRVDRGEAFIRPLVFKRIKPTAEGKDCHEDSSRRYEDTYRRYDDLRYDHWLIVSLIDARHWPTATCRWRGVKGAATLHGHMLTCLDHTWGTFEMIPDYQTLMLPILELASDGQEHRIGDVIEPLGKKFGLRPDEFAEMLPSRRQAVFNSRVHWAKTYLAQAKLLEITRRAHFRITDRGREVLRKNPSRVDVRLLEQFPEFNEFKERARASQTGAAPSASTADVTTAEVTTKTPDEILANEFGKAFAAAFCPPLH
jgi:hypothetical protein